MLYSNIEKFNQWTDYAIDYCIGIMWTQTWFLVPHLWQLQNHRLYWDEIYKQIPLIPIFMSIGIMQIGRVHRVDFCVLKPASILARDACNEKSVCKGAAALKYFII